MIGAEDMNPSSNRMKHEILTHAEILVLDLLANTLLEIHDLPEHVDTICQLLRSHGFARARNIKSYGGKTHQAWDITDEGQTYLIKHYKRAGGHV